jgi:hypothetical protein
MKPRAFFLSLLTVLSFSIPCFLQAAEYSSHDEFNERDFEAVTDFIKTKRMTSLYEKSCDLSISGDIRMEWESIKEKHDGFNLRGRTANRNVAWYGGAPPPTNQFDVEFNLMFDYKGDCTWAVAHLEFDNNAGIDVNPRGCGGDFVFGTDDTGAAANGFRAGDPRGGQGSGVSNNLSLRKAYFGYNIFEGCCCRADIEIGRRHLYDVFDSRVQFRSRFDGILLRLSNSMSVGELYLNFGAFVKDENMNRFGYALEVGLLDIVDYGVDLKYSFIDWANAGRRVNRCDVLDPAGERFVVSQLMLAYQFNPEYIKTRAKVYGALLFNHAAQLRTLAGTSFNDKRKDLGWYVGVLIGDVRCEGDWSVDINYQYVEAGVIPDFDVTGIGRGNVRDIPMTVSSTWGNTNYKGFRLEGLYALTDNIALNPSWDYSTEEDVNIGGKHSYSKFELQFIYAF